MNERARRLADLTPEQRERLLLRAQQRRAATAAARVTIPRRSDPERPCVLSFSQERLWFLEQLEPGSTAYHIRAVIEMRGPLRHDLLQRALGALAERHESLRTFFSAEDGAVKQRVSASVDVPLAIHDLRRDVQQREHLAAVLESEASRPFDLQRAPLLRATLVGLENEHHVLAFTIHHIVSDGWSLGVIVRDVVEAYAALARGETPRLPPLPIQYGDYAEWQRGTLSGDALERGLGYWLSRLSGLEPAGVPPDRPRPAKRDSKAQTIRGRLPPELVDRLHELAREQGVSLYIVLLTIVGAALARNARASDVAVGTPIAGRALPETEELIGFFVNTLVMRLDCSGDPTLAELLLRARDTALDAYAHQSIPFEKVVEALAPQRRLGETPLFQLMLTLQNLPASELAVEGLVFSPMPADAATAKFDLELTFVEDTRGLGYTLEYAADIFEHTSVERFSRHVLAFATALLDEPHARLGKVALLSADEREHLIVGLNPRAKDEPAREPMHRCFEHHARQRPDAVAVRSAEGQMTYGELDRLANRIARLLAEAGAGPERRVALLLPRSSSLVAAVLGTLKAGAAYVPLDASHPDRRLWHAIQDSAAEIVLTESALADRVLASGARAIALDREELPASDDAAKSSTGDTPLGLDVHPERLAYVIYTSGSTGSPKGTLVTHGGLANYLAWARGAYAVGPGSSSAVISPIAFDLTVTSLLLPLYAGGSVELAPEGDAIDVLQSLLRGEGRDLLKLTPSHLVALEQIVPVERMASVARTFVIGGEALHGEQLRAWFEHAPRARLINEYGPTETVVGCAIHEAAPGTNAHGPIPLGRPIAATELYVLDPELEPVPVGVWGELFIGGAGVARGYARLPALTAERFVPNPFGPRAGGRMYRTGDRCRWRSDGLLEFGGRFDDQVKLRGYRIELGEIEAALREQPSIRDAVVTLATDGSEQHRIVAYVVLDPPQQLSEVTASLAERLPGYMMPAAFVRMDALPLTPNGKIDRRALPRPHAETAGALDPPQTATEQALAEVWRELLGTVLVERGSDFFELGGHSLVAMRVLPRVHSLFGVALPLRALFETPKLSALAQRIDDAHAEGSRPSLPPLARCDRAKAQPLSHAQQRLWFLEQLAPGTAAYHVPLAVRIRGALDEPALEQALGCLIQRHESLRTTITSDAGVPLQRANEATPLELSRVTLESADGLRELLAAETSRPFDLAVAPLVRALLVTVGPDDHVLCLTLHHIATDAWSTNVILRELITFYEAAVVGATVELPPLPFSYVDFAAWQHALLSSGALQHELDYWVDRLAGLKPLALPTDRPRPRLRSSRGGAVRFSIPAGDLAALRRLAREQNATLYMTVLAALAALLSRYGGQEDVAIGTTIGGRTQRELEGVVGFFVSTLVLRLDVGPELTLRELVTRAREVCLSAFTHQDVPFEKIVEALDPERDLTKTPLFDVMLVMQSAPPARASVAGATLEPVSVELPAAKFDLMFTLSELDGALGGALVYASELFDHATAERLAGHFVAMLAALASMPEACVGRVPLLSPEERDRLLVGLNPTAVDEPSCEPIHRRFERHARERPDEIALLWAERRISYRELDDLANRIARLLADQGVGPETRVALLLPRSPWLVAALLGTLKAGAAYVPLDPSHPTRRLCHAIEDSAAEVVLTDSRLVERVLAAAPLAFALDRTELPAGDLPLDVAVHPEQLAYVIYTSGSTGTPKGTLITHGGLANYLAWAMDEYGIRAGSRSAVFSSVAFDLTVTSLLLPLFAGGTVELAAEGDALAVLEALASGGGHDLLKLTPSHLVALERLVAPERLGGIAKTFVIGGEALHGEQLRAWYRHAPSSRFINEYGPTETVVGCAIHEARAERDREGPVAIGRPIAATEIYVLDRALEPVPIGVWGELYIGGAGVARGYAGLPALTAERFVPNPFGSREGSRLYRTGDRSRWRSDGVLEFGGRFDDQIKLRGHRIEPGEIEAVLRQHPAVRDGVVVLRSDSGEPRLVAYAVGGADEAELRTFLAERLPEAMLPSAIVGLPRLPLAASGKVDRAALPAPLAPSAELESAPASPLEERLAALYAALLGRDRVPLEASFFALGGHSLLATQLVARLRSELGVELPLRAIFEAPSIRELALRLGALLAEEHSAGRAIVAAPRAASLPLSFAQERLWFIDQLEPGSTAYVVDAAFVIEGELDLGALERALRGVVLRHEPLRTRFVTRGGTAVQEIDETAHFDFRHEELECEPDRRRELVLDALRELGDTPFDLERGPLLRVRLSTFGSGQHALCFAVHHAVFDGWSASVLVRDLCELYAAEREGRAPSLAPLEIQYADYAVWQRGWLAGPEHAAQLAYWKSQLADLAPLELPADRKRPAIFSTRGARERFALDKATFARLRELAESEGATSFMVLLAAYLLLLGRHAGRDDVAVGGPIAGRTHHETEPLVGLFVNTLVFRANLARARTPRELLRLVREVVLEAFAHQETPFELVVKELAPERDPSRAPLIQASLSFQNVPEARLESAGLAFSRLASDVATTLVDLMLFANERNGAVDGVFIYAADLFDADSIGRLARRFETLLERFGSAPDGALDELECLAPGERAELLRLGSGPSAPLPRASTAHAVFERVARERSEHVALRFGEREISYAELDAGANRLAWRLRALGAGPDMLVGIALSRSVELVTAMLGVLKSGAAYVPLDVDYPAARLAALMEGAGLSLLISSQALIDELPVSGALIVLADDPSLEAEPPSAPPEVAVGSSLAYVIHTSGSTGVPKGVMIPHAGLINTALAQNAISGVGPHDRTLQFASPAFDASVSEIFTTLFSGGTLELAERAKLMPGPEFARWLRESAPTMATLPPSVLALMDDAELASLRVLFSAGEACPLELARRLSVGREFYNAYGPTEITVCATMARCDPGASVVTIGRPIPGVVAHVLDAALRLAPIGVWGELCVGGAGVARGYLGRADLTAERFVPNPFGDGGRLYRTGDRCRVLASGAIEFSGRLDDQIKLRGFRIEPGEIIAALRGHPAVADATVVTAGSGASMRLVAYVVCDAGEPPTAAALRTFLEQQLPVHMLPSAFVTLDELPLTSSGKIDRRALPEPAPVETLAGDALPSTPTEQVIAQIWADVLEVPRVGQHDRFFDLGGHSLLATQVVARVGEAFGKEVPLIALFESPELGDFAARVEEIVRGEQARVVPLVPRPRDEPPPLSFSQERVWFIEQLDPGTTAFSMREVMALDGALDVSALEHAFGCIVERHEILRTTFESLEGRPVQVVHPAAPLEIPVVDLSGLSDSERDRARAEQIERLVREPIDLARGPLLRLRLLRLAPEEHLLLMNIHHLAFDGWSVAVLLRELMMLYAAATGGPEAALPELRVQYADFARWQRQLLTGAELEVRKAYWAEQLADGPEPLQLPTDRPRPTLHSFRGETLRVDLPTELTARLHAVCRQAGVTPFMALLAVFDVLLHRYSGQNDIAVGSPISNRPRAELEPLIGYFLNTLVLRADLSRNPSFDQLLLQIREVALGAYAHQDIPFEELARTAERDLAKSPLFQVMFVLQTVPRERLQIPGLRVKRLRTAAGVAKFDLTLALEETGANIAGELEYNTDLFDETTVAQMWRHFTVLAEALLGDPSRRIDDVVLVDSEERKRILRFGAPARVASAGDLPSALIEAQARATPDAPALIWQPRGDGSTALGRQLSYADFVARAGALAGDLERHGVGPETLVALAAERAPETFIGLLGILRAGAAYVPIDLELPADRIAYLLEDSRARAIVVPSRLLDSPKLGTIPRIPIRDECVDFTAPPVSPESVAYVIYTSGSTGLPKGVPVPKRAVSELARSAAEKFRLTPRDRVLQFHSLSFDASVEELFPAWSSGAAVVLYPDRVPESFDRFAAFIELHSITVLDLPTAFWHVWAEALGARRARLPETLRLVVIGGEAALPARLADFQAVAGDRVELCNTYGPTEATVSATAYGPDDRDPIRERERIPIGRPLPHVGAYVLDRALELVPVGVKGRLYLAGAGLARGYLRRPGLTAERFVPHPFAAGERLYDTGDLARWLPSGELLYQGRADRQIKLRGYRIELEEIEAALVACPGVREAIVVLDSEGRDPHLVAYVVGPAANEPAAIARHLERTLPAFMVPSVFVARDALPVTPTGKIDRRALQAPPPAPIDDFVAPVTKTEELVAQLFADVLRVPSVGRHDSFFGLGGHSLLATQLVSRIQSALSIDLPLRTIFRAPKVSDLAREVEKCLAKPKGTDRPPITRAHRGPVVPLSFQQERLWFFDQLDPGNPVFNIAGGMRIRGALDASAMQRALDSLAQRHEALRTRFSVRDGGAVQIVDSEGTYPLLLRDLTALAPVAQQSAIREALTRESRRRFDLTSGPLVHAELLRLAPDDHVLVNVMHHIVADGWSMGIVMREVAELYAAHAADRPPSLPPLDLQYADYALWQRRWLTPEVLASQLEYWKQKLSGAPPLSLPTDRPRSARREYRGAAAPLTLSVEQSTAVRALAEREGVTLYMVLLAAFQVLLAQWSGQEDVVVGSPIANRSEQETERIVGFFLNNLALRVRIQPELSVRELLASVRETCLSAYANQQVPFEQILESVDIERDATRNPLIQVGFTFQNAHSTKVDLSDLSFERLDPETTSEHYELWLMLWESRGSITGKIDYTTDLFDAETVERMVGHLIQLLAAFAAEPEARIRQLDLTRSDERALLAAGWQSTEEAHPLQTPVHALFEASAARHSDHVALECGESFMSYGELDRRVNRLAHRLLREAVRAGDRVAIILDRSVDFVVAALAALKAGAAYVPIDPNLPRERVLRLLASARPRAVVSARSVSAGAIPGSEALPTAIDLESEDLSDEPPTSPGTDVSSWSLCSLIHTSGGGGGPLGVMLTHRGLVNFVCGAIGALELGPKSRVLQLSSPSFDSWIWETLCTLLAGGTVCMPPRGKQLTGIDLYNWIRAERITAALLTPSTLATLPAGELPELSTLCCAGEAVAQELVATWAPGRRFLDAYGSSETSVCVTHAEISATDERVSIGRPWPNNKVYVLDQRLALVPVGVVGELCVAGPGVALGYWGNPELTAERFVPNPFGSGERLYRTGDLCRWRADGQLEFLGRADRRIKFRGYRLELAEIEAVLRSHPLVDEAIVVVRKHGPDEPILLAYVASPGEALGARELRELCESRLPSYMVPELISVLDALPKRASGEIDQLALPAPAAEDEELELDPPRTPVEDVIASVFAEVLGLECVGIFENFFDLGGHSLLAMQIASLLLERLSIELPVRTIFEAQTVASLAQHAEELLREGASVRAPPLLPARRDELLPLSFAQERLWFLDQLTPGRATYNMPFALRLRGSLAPQHLKRAFTLLVDRHESLRTTFETAPDGRAVQRISAVPNAVMELVSLLGEPDPEAKVRELARSNATTPFNLGAGPVIRASLLTLSPEEHVLLLCVHHVACDGWSLAVLVREMVELYDALSVGRVPSLDPLPIQYADFAAWQRNYLSGETLERELGFWRERLEDVPTLSLPTDRPRPAVQTDRGGVVSFEIGSELTQALEQLARALRASLFMTLAAAFQVLLGRLSRQEDFAIGAPIAGRNRPETERLIGFFVNMFVLRARLTPNLTFRELLSKVRDETLSAYAHQDMPFDRLVDALGVERDLSQSPIYQVVFSLQNTPRATLRRRGLVIEAVPNDATVAKYDLTLSVAPRDSVLRGDFEFNADLFDRTTIERWGRHFVRLLESIVANPDETVTRLRLLSDEEHSALIALGGPHRAAAGECLHERVSSVASRRPHHPAVEGVGETLTYRDLEEQSNGLASELARRGIGPDALVAILLRRSPRMVVALLGVLKAGAAYVPLDPNTPTQRLATLATPTLLLTESALEDRAPEGWARLALDRTPIPKGHAPRRVVSPDAAAYVIYTSGSTGSPKGVVVAHRSVCAMVDSVATTLAADESMRVLNFFSFAFDGSVWEIFLALLNGATLCMASANAVLAGAELSTVLRERRISYLIATPSALMQMPAAELPDLRILTAGGEACPADLPRRWAKGRHFYNMYGPTECTVISTLARLDGSETRVGIGRAIGGGQAYVLDRELQPVPIGVPGELCIGGIGLARGYLESPELTATRFVPHPWRAGERLYRSGDLVRWLPDGTLEYLGRLDDQVKVRGFRIELGDIEAALRRSEGVLDAVAMVRQDDLGTRRLVAYVQAAPQRKLDAAALAQRLAAELPPYMLPSAIVELEEFPRTSSGKIRKNVLPEPERRTADRALATPRSKPEEILCRILSSLLPVEAVGVDDNFFSLGGDSILAIQLVARARQAGVVISVRDVFTSPTAAQLAAGARLTPAAEAEQGLVQGSVPLTPIQRWFFAQNRNHAHFNQALLFELDQPLDHSLLEQTVRSVVQHHDALRLTFRETAGGIEQTHESEVGELVRCIDLGGCAREDLRSEIERVCAEQQASFDLARGPLFRVVMIELGRDDGARLLIVAHHLVVDGVSWRILLEDLETTYQRLSRSQPAALPPKTTSFQRFAERLWEHAATPEFQERLSYWLAAVPSSDVHRLPRDHDALEVSGAGEAVAETLSAEDTLALLREIPKQLDTGIEDCLLAACALALTQWAGGSAARVMLEAHGRDELADDLELTRTVGWFTELFPVTLPVASSADVGETLELVKDALRSVRPLARSWGLLRFGGGEAQAALGRIPPPEVSFNYLGQTRGTLGEASLFAPARESSGPTEPADSPRPHLLDITAIVLGGRLRVSIDYSRNVHQKQTIAALLGRIRAALTSLIEASRREALAPVQRFAQAKLSPATLEKVLKRQSKKR